MPNAVPIYLVNANQLQNFQDHKAWIQASAFRADPGTYCLIPGDDGIGKVLVGRPEAIDTWTLGALPAMLPPHSYALADDWSPEEATKLCLGWRLGQYRFDRYRQNQSQPLAQLMVPAPVDAAYVDAATTAVYLVRDLVNTPAGDMGPDHLEDAVTTVAKTFQAELQIFRGEDLLSENYPMIHGVGRASDEAPRLLDLRWGDPDHPKVTLVGKGVCFDSGGLNIKNAAGMRLMKKDMGGAANTLGLAQMIMAMKLPVRLRLLIPAVENSIAGNATHPLDVLPSRKGLTVEIGNTDAEGRLVLADALWEGCREDPGLIVDFATLTGAARVALGTELPACFCSDEEVGTGLIQAGLAVDDPLWQLPLHQPYRSMLESKVADLSNIGNSSYGGSITAALFLQEFVKPAIPWVHIDLMAWNLRSLPGRPEGGEAMGIRAVYELIRRRFT
ncbi:leucyl aminopeptidase [filamentous cyanobacterium CCP5]|nr:leucyl aminopeptidase [filamentous cyanobacterium CCP5]